MVKDKRLKAKLNTNKVIGKEIKQRLKEREILLPEQSGFLEADEEDGMLFFKLYIAIC